MTKQEKIREGMEHILKVKEMTKVTRDAILEYQLKFLKSEGMVLKNEDIKNDILANMGLYPRSVVSGKHPYKKRSQYQEGWNAALMEVATKQCKSKFETGAYEELI